MNKLRLIKIYELRGKIHPIEQWVIDLLDGIEQVLDNDSIGYCKNGIFYFTYYLNSNNLWLSSYLENDLETIFKTKYGCSYEETKEIMKYLLEKHLNITINRVR